MNAYELASYLKAFIADKTDYDQEYILNAAQVLLFQAEKIADLQTTVSFLEEETKALRKQLISATNAVMEYRR
jgi:hypothetical protein